MRKKIDMAGFFKGTLRSFFGFVGITGGNTTEGKNISQDVKVIQMGASAGTAPNYDWSVDLKTQTGIVAGTVLDFSLTGIPGAFSLSAVSSVTPINNWMQIQSPNKVKFLRYVPVGVDFNVSGVFSNPANSNGTATLIISGDTVTNNNTTTTLY